MKNLRHILSITIIALSTIMLLAHNIVPHHHSAIEGLTACHDHTPQAPAQATTEPLEAIIPCNAASHSCAHDSHQTQYSCNQTHHCDHSLCTLLYEFLSAQNSNSHPHSQLAFIISPIYTPQDELLAQETEKYYVQRHIPLDQHKLFRDTPRRAPPVA